MGVLIRDGKAIRGVMQLRGSVLCAGCSLEEVRAAQPDEHKLYQLAHSQGQVVMKVSAINNSQRLDYFTWPSRIQVRGEDSLFDKLTAEENLFKEIEITGLLNNPRTLDIFAVTVHG